MASQPDVTPPTAPRLLDAGDAAFTVEFGSTLDSLARARVGALDRAVERERLAGRLPGLIEAMPTFRSLTLFYDPLATDRRTLVAALAPLLDGLVDDAAPPGRCWRLPVCYEGDAAPDLADTAVALGLAEAEVVALHSGAEFTVGMLGFLPGFPFLVGLPPALQRPRRTEPRVRVPAGSVAIAGLQSAIYPWQSPGGWHLIGRCPVRLFDPSWTEPALLAAGDAVRFEAIDSAELQRLQAAVGGDELPPSHWHDDAAGAAR